MRVPAFRHVPFEGLGLIEPALESRGIAFDYADLYPADLYRAGVPLPDTSRYDGLIFLGGPMSANDPLPYLRTEIGVIARCNGRHARAGRMSGRAVDCQGIGRAGLEVTPQMIVDWCVQDQNCGDMRELSAPPDPRFNRMRLNEIARLVFGQWCDPLP